MNPTTSRRDFIVSLAAAGAALSLGLVVTRPLWDNDPLYAEVTERLTDGGHARRLGRLYLEQVPEEADSGVLVDLIFPDLPAEGQGPGQSEVAREVMERICRDYAEGRFVTVEGWVVAETEARLWALASVV